MTTTPRIVWRRKAFPEIRNLETLQRELLTRARQGAHACGDGFVARSSSRPTRARAAVIAATIRARRAEARDHLLLGRGLDAMRS
ncbi:hypothetical protein [Nocardia otitidiscaviarum]|uniref:hypothetical protein n=1 Tax=Nocardia otitidiscaviarum TaxID=1823 RepID=UPI0004A6B8EC|nr:hypothetical protein [Nocardia otitidiscaviarum]